MQKAQPIVCRWDGTTLVPVPRYARVAAKQFEVGAEYPLEIVQNRSKASHDQFFAAVGEAFSNLPERLAPSFPSAEHLRKWALIQCGHFDQREIEFDTQADAERVARFCRVEDEFARIRVERVEADDRISWTVIVRRAKSQSLGAMRREEFERTKKDVLDLLESITSVPRGSLMREAGRSA